MKWIENYFGSYDLQTGKLYKSSIKLPFSINPYYITYSSTRKEVYMVGKDAVIYVIDVSTSNYTIKSTIGIPGKIEGPSGIKIRPDEKILFVSCPDSNLIFVIDLDQRKVIKQLALSFPYKMEFF